MTGAVEKGQGLLNLSDQDFEAIAAFAQKDFALKLDLSKKSMVFRRLSPHIRDLGMAGFPEYTARLAHDQSERLKLLSLLTTNLTHFFREKHHFDIMRKKAFPQMLEKLKIGARARIWSCACSSGEEPYSLAMEVCEAFPSAATSNLKILATDIDPEILDRAKAGMYTLEQIKGVPAHLRSKYLTQKSAKEQLFSVNPEVRKLISFGQLNLPADWPFEGEFDVIFCRNVAIYFSSETQERLWSRLIDRLPVGGILCIGHSERISPKIASRLKMLGQTAYQKQ